MLNLAMIGEVGGSRSHKLKHLKNIAVFVVFRLE